MSILVVKLGTNAIMTSDGDVDRIPLENVSRGIASLLEAGVGVVLVSSGATGMGTNDFPKGRKGTLSSVEKKQICSAIGQPRLMKAFRTEFQKYNIPVAQALVTRFDFVHRKRQLGMRNIISRMLSCGVLPIVNENDFLTPEEMDFSDNDQLACFIAGMLRAETLVLLSNVAGLYTGNPNLPTSKKIDTVSHITPQIESYVTSEQSKNGTGGMKSKMYAAKILSQLGVEMILGDSREPNILQNIQKKIPSGTRFLAQKGKKKSGLLVWLAAGAAEKGKIVVDENLSHLLRTKKSGISLLDIGVMRIIGTFDAGDAIGIFDMKKRHIARGVAKLSAHDMRHTQEHRDGKSIVLVHADQLLVL